MACSPLNPLRMSQGSTATKTLRLPGKLSMAFPEPGAASRWYFTSPDGAKEDTGVTTESYTITPADCSTCGWYRVHVTDSCGDSSDVSGAIQALVAHSGKGAL
jgi:hypothetical protein